jgi:hypothetical protein
MLRNIDLSVDEIGEKTRNLGLPMSRLLISEIRRSFLDDLRFLADVGLLAKGLPSARRRVTAQSPPSTNRTRLSSEELEDVHLNKEDLREIQRDEAYRRRRRNRRPTSFGLENKE